VQRLEIVVAIGNDASLNAARKAGAFDEGIARKRLKLGQQWVDAHMLSLVKP
jgi:RimJ/RimL family protein N-acetyltransferase